MLKPERVAVMSHQRAIEDAASSPTKAMWISFIDVGLKPPISTGEIESLPVVVNAVILCHANPRKAIRLCI